MTDDNMYLVLHGWSEYAAFERFPDAMLFRAIMDELYPEQRFDIWLQSKRDDKDWFMVSRGEEPICETQGSRGCAALMIGRHHDRRAERR